MQFVARLVARQEEFENTDIAYVAVTRFNIFRPEVLTRPLKIPAGTPEWCARRAEGFRSFCLPPMLKQRLIPHAWFILFDADLNEPVRRLIDELRAYPWIVPLFVTREEAHRYTRAIAPPIRERLAARGARFICGVRLDSDDSLSLLYFAALDAAISRLRAEWDDDMICCVNFPYGVLREGDRFTAYLSEKHFFGLVEPFATFRTPYQRKHRDIDQVAPVVDVFTESPMWLYHRHQANVGRINVHHFEEFAEPRRIARHFGFDSIPEDWDWGAGRAVEPDGGGDGAFTPGDGIP